jgi:hypothetical protein
MKVFISWSGTRSKLVAELLNDWIKCVIQATRPWISTRDIDRGALWFNAISDQLKDTRIGIICLTSENRNKPWILFEAGALAKGLSSTRVCTFLIDIIPSDVEDPLAQFNHTLPNQDGLRELVKTINNCLGESALDGRILEQIFITYWPQFESSFNEIIKTSIPAEKQETRSDKTLLSEILDNTRYLAQKVHVLESRIEVGHLPQLPVTTSSLASTLLAGSKALKRAELFKPSPKYTSEQTQNLREALKQASLKFAPTQD